MGHPGAGLPALQASGQALAGQPLTSGRPVPAAATTSGPQAASRKSQIIYDDRQYSGLPLG